jgi:Leucine rich repeat variant
MTHRAPRLSPDLERARSIKTSPRDLERLETHRDARVRAAVAGNPNVPLGTLQRLSVRHASAVLRNPVLDLLTLENPNWLSELPDFARIALLRDPNCPSAWLTWALTRGVDLRTWQGVVQNTACPVELLETLSVPESPVARAASLHIGLTERDAAPESFEKTVSSAASDLDSDNEVLKDALAAGIVAPWLLEVLARNADLELRLLVIRQPHLSDAALEALLLSDEETVREAARARPLPKAVLDWIERAERGDDLTASEMELLLLHDHGRFLVARHSRLNDQLEALRSSDDWRVRQAVALNVNASPTTLGALAADTDKDVRITVAAHPRTPPSALARLMLDANDDVRAAARLNPASPEVLRHTLERLEANDASLSAGTLERLARRDETLAVLSAAQVNASASLLRHLAFHDDWKVRQAVARHPRVPADVLERLSADADFDVRGAVAIHPAIPPRLLSTLERDAHPLVRSGVALNTLMTTPSLERLAMDSDPDVRQAVAVNPLASSTLLDRLGRDETERVRRAVALHPATSSATLERLSADDDADVRAVVADHPAATVTCSLGIFGRMFEWQDVYARLKRGAELLEREWQFLSGLNDFAQQLTLHHPHCPPSLLERFAASDDWKERQAVARHPATSLVLLETLSRDGDYDVREAVARHARAPLSAVERLARDDHAAVRKGIAERAHLPAQIAEILAWDEDDDIVSSLATRGDRLNIAATLRTRATRGDVLEPAALEALREIDLPLARRCLARQPMVTPDDLRALCADSDWRVRLEVARHAHSDDETLEVLLGDADTDVRRGVASNPRLPDALLERLLRDEDATVRREASAHPALGDVARRAVQSRLLTRLLVTPGLSRAVALESPHLPRSEFGKSRNLHALEWLERFALARNPNAPETALRVLSEDANRLVRDTARTALQTRGEQ